MPKDKLGDINLMLLMNLDRYTFAIVRYSNGTIFLDIDLNFCHFVIPLIVVSSIHQHLVKYLVKSRNILNLLIDHLVVMQNPHVVLNGRY